MLVGRWGAGMASPMQVRLLPPLPWPCSSFTRECRLVAPMAGPRGEFTDPGSTHSLHATCFLLHAGHP